MFKVQSIIHGSMTEPNSIAMTAMSDVDQYFIFPKLVLKTIDRGTGKPNICFKIQRRSEHYGPVGYYVYRYLDECDEPLVGDMTHIVTSYLPDEDEFDYIRLKDLPRQVLKVIIRNYVRLTVANLFECNGFRHICCAAVPYSNDDFPNELNDAIETFVHLECNQILG